MVRLTGDFLMAFGSIVGGNVVYTYIADTYVARADMALVVVNGLKNLTAFGTVLAVVPWSTPSGYTVTFGCLAVIRCAIHLPIQVLYFYGAVIREWQLEHLVHAKKGPHGEGIN